MQPSKNSKAILAKGLGVSVSIYFPPEFRQHGKIEK